MNTKTESRFYKKKLIILVILLLCCNALSMGSSAASVWYCKQLNNNDAHKYVIHIGLNDKDTNTQKYTIEEASQIVNTICERYVDGYSCVQMNGGWGKDEDTYVKEKTLVYEFVNAQKEQVQQIMDEAVVELNQECILFEQQEVDYSYYYGKQDK